MAEPGRTDIGFLVGLKAEAHMVRAFWPGAPVAISGATQQGAENGAARLIACGVKQLVSFGLAAGLDPALSPGDIVIPDVVMMNATLYPCDQTLRSHLGAIPGDGRAGALLHSDMVVTDSARKEELARATGCCALDMESGFLAQAASKAHRPFAVLRVICDPATRSLPPAAELTMSPDGGIDAGRLALSLLRSPKQIAGLIGLGVDAFRARRAMHHFLATHITPSA